MSHDAVIQLIGTTEELIVRRITEEDRESWIRTLEQLRCLREVEEDEGPTLYERLKSFFCHHPWLIMITSFASLVMGIFH